MLYDVYVQTSSLLFSQDKKTHFRVSNTGAFERKTERILIKAGNDLSAALRTAYYVFHYIIRTQENNLMGVRIPASN